jgi:hypothetical protein
MISSGPQELLPAKEEETLIRIRTTRIFFMGNLSIERYAHKQKTI